MIRLDPTPRPRAMGEVCDAALESLRQDLGVMFAASWLVNAPLAACALGLLYGVAALGKSNAVFIFPLALVGAALTILRPVAQGAVMLAARERIERGRAASLGAVWREAARRALPASFAASVFWFGFLAGGLIYVVPGLLFGGWCLLGVPAAVLEGRSPLGSIRRSAELLRGHVGRGIFLLILLGVATAVLAANAHGGAHLALLLGRVLFGFKTAFYEAILTPQNGLYALAVVLAVYLVLEPWKACAIYHLHLDARVRFQALDLLQAVERFERERDASKARDRALAGAPAAEPAPLAGAIAGGGA